MQPPPTLTIRSEEERNVVGHLRQALLWRVKVQLASAPTLTAEQFQQMVSVALMDAQALAAEAASFFPALDALQKVGWKPADAFDRAVPPFGGAPAQPGGAPPPQAQQPQQPNRELDAFGRDLKKGFQEMGGAIDGWLGGKKKQ